MQSVRSIEESTAVQFRSSSSLPPPFDASDFIDHARRGRVRLCMPLQEAHTWAEGRHVPACYGIYACVFVGRVVAEASSLCKRVRVWKGSSSVPIYALKALRAPFPLARVLSLSSSLPYTHLFPPLSPPVTPYRTVHLTLTQQPTLSSTPLSSPESLRHQASLYRLPRDPTYQSLPHNTSATSHYKQTTTPPVCAPTALPSHSSPSPSLYTLLP